MNKPLFPRNLSCWATLMQTLHENCEFWLAKSSLANPRLVSPRQLTVLRQGGSHIRLDLRLPQGNVVHANLVNHSFEVLPVGRIAANLQRVR